MRSAFLGLPTRPAEHSGPPPVDVHEWCLSTGFDEASREYRDLMLAAETVEDLLNLSGHPELDDIVAGWKPLRKRRFLRAIGGVDARKIAAVSPRPGLPAAAPRAAAHSPGAFARRRRRCGECVGCLASDCNACYACRDKVKNGGKGTGKQSCLRRKCGNPWLPSAESDASRAGRTRCAEAPDRDVILRRFAAFLAAAGADPARIPLWSARVEVRRFGDTAGTYDIYYTSPGGATFRSRVAVLRHLGLEPP